MIRVRKSPGFLKKPGLKLGLFQMPGFFQIWSIGPFIDTITERDDLQGEEGLKSLAPPLTAQTAGAIEPIFGLGILHRHRIGVTVAILEFSSGTPKNRPPRANWGWGPQILGGQFFGVPDGNSKIATVTPVLCL